MTIDELQKSPLWKVLSADARKVLTKAQALGWELHGKGATIVFRLDRDQDDLDLPCYVEWDLGLTPGGAASYTAGRGGVPHRSLTGKDVLEYLEDPSVVYPLEDDCRPSEELVTDILGASPASSSISVSGVVTSGTPAEAGTRSTAPSTGTGKLRLPTTQSSSDSGATGAAQPGTSGTSSNQKSAVTSPLRVGRPRN